MRSLTFLPAFLLAAATLAGCLVGEQAPKGDSDGDYLQDEDETLGRIIRIWLDVRPCFSDASVEPVERNVTSSPSEFDTDFDGLDDGQEAQWGSDPREADTDQDGLGDAEEVRLSKEGGFALTGHLKPYKADSDDDCLSDASEINGTTIPGLGLRTTDPTVADTDQDGLSDPHEALVSFTDPTNPNTDGDDADDMADLDPLRDLGVSLTFDRLEVKGSGYGSVPVRFYWTFETADGLEEAPSDLGSFEASPGQATAVPAEQSPGIVNTKDKTVEPFIQFHFWAVREDTGATLNLTPSGPGHIALIRIDPSTLAWSVDATTGNADGSTGVLDTSEARLEFRVRVATF